MFLKQNSKATTSFVYLSLNISLMHLDGTLVYSVNGYNVRFTYNGRDNLLTCERSNVHEKYPNCNWMSVFDSNGLILSDEEFEVFFNSIVT